MQKSIVRNGLIAVLFAFIAILAFMPQKASALVSYGSLGTMNGYQYTLVDTIESEDETYTLDATTVVIEDYYDNDFTSQVVSGKTIDLEKAAQLHLEAYKKKVGKDYDGNTISFYISVKGKKADQGEKDFDEMVQVVKIDAQATTSEVVTEDTTFTYDVDTFILTDIDYDDDSKVSDESFELKKSEAATLAKNTLTIPKGSSVSALNDYLVMIIRNNARRTYTYDKEKGVETDVYEYAYVIKEVASSNNKVSLSKNEVMITDRGIYEDLAGEEAEAKVKEEDYYVVISLDSLGNGSTELLATLNGYCVKAHNIEVAWKKGELTKKEYSDARDALDAEFQAYASKLTVLNTKTDAKVATFTHPGVNTGDSNNMVLFVVLFVMAVVAAGAVALKRN